MLTIKFRNRNLSVNTPALVKLTTSSTKPMSEPYRFRYGWAA